MLIEFKKGKQKPSTLTCKRSDGSITWTRMHPGIEVHDFAHYVVESEMGYSDAFFGSILNGYSIQDFELPRAKRPDELLPVNLSQNALVTEHLVNLLQVGLSKSREEFDLLASLTEILTDNNLDLPGELDKHSLNTIQLRLESLLQKWEDLDEGATIELHFELND